VEPRVFDEVLSSARTGDVAALGEMYRFYQPSLVRYLRANAPDAADDLASETWLDVAGGLERFSGGEPDFRRWLFTIARRRSIDHWRMVKRRPPEVGDEFVDLPQPDQPDQLAIESAIAELTRGLSAEQSEVVILRVVAGLGVEQVAEIVGKSPGAVRVIQHRALRRLAAQAPSGCVTP